MRKWLVALALVAGLTAEAQPLSGGLLGRGASYSGFVPPSGCASGYVPYFDATLKLVCSPTVWNPATKSLDVTDGRVQAANLKAIGLATPGGITVVPTLSKIGAITAVAGSALADGDALSVGDGTGIVPMEFDAAPGDGTTGGAVAIIFDGTETATEIRDAIKAILDAAGRDWTTSNQGADGIGIVRATPGATGGAITEAVTDAGFLVTDWTDPTHATTVTYQLVACLADGSCTEPGADSTTGTATATLSAANYNALSWSAVSGAASYKVYRKVAPTSPATVGVIYAGTALTVDDTGLAGDTTTASTVDGTGRVTADGLTIATGAAAGHVLTADASGNATWQAGGGGITNAAGANVIPKSDGTNLVASALSESSAGAFATSAGTALGLTATAPAATTGASQAGVGVTITASPAVASTDTAGAAAGGSVGITAGNAARLTSGNANGGDITLTTGVGIGTGTAGALNVYNAKTVFNSSGGSGAWTFTGGIDATFASGNAASKLTVNNGFLFDRTGSAFSFGSNTVRAKGTANPAWGAASATPVAYLHNFAADARSGTDTNVRGGTARIAPGVGTGSGGSGDLIAQTAPKGSSGTTANALVDRVYLYSIAKDLTDGSATGLFEVALPSGSHVGITVEATVNVENASDYQTRRVSMNLSAHNKGGTVTSSTPTEYGASALLDSGTLTTAWTVTNGTGKITVNLNADSDLATQTRLNVRYQVRVDGDLGTLVTPL